MLLLYLLLCGAGGSILAENCPPMSIIKDVGDFIQNPEYKLLANIINKDICVSHRPGQQVCSISQEDIAATFSPNIKELGHSHTDKFGLFTKLTIMDKTLGMWIGERIVKGHSYLRQKQARKMGQKIEDMQPFIKAPYEIVEPNNPEFPFCLSPTNKTELREFLTVYHPQFPWEEREFERVPNYIRNTLSWIKNTFLFGNQENIRRIKSFLSGRTDTTVFTYFYFGLWPTPEQEKQVNLIQTNVGCVYDIIKLNPENTLMYKLVEGVEKEEFKQWMSNYLYVGGQIWIHLLSQMDTVLDHLGEKIMDWDMEKLIQTLNVTVRDGIVEELMNVKMYDNEEFWIKMLKFDDMIQKAEWRMKNGLWPEMTNFFDRIFLSLKSEDFWVKLEEYVESKGLRLSYLPYYQKQFAPQLFDKLKVTNLKEFLEILKQPAGLVNYLQKLNIDMDIIDDWVKDLLAKMKQFERKGQVGVTAFFEYVLGDVITDTLENIATFMKDDWEKVPQDFTAFQEVDKGVLSFAFYRRNMLAYIGFYDLDIEFWFGLLSFNI